MADANTQTATFFRTHQRRSDGLAAMLMAESDDHVLIRVKFFENGSIKPRLNTLRVSREHWAENYRPAGLVTAALSRARGEQG